MAEQRAQEMMQNGNEVAAITFYKDNTVEIAYPNNINKSTHTHEFDTFDEARSFFLQMIGALYRDGYR